MFRLTDTEETRAMWNGNRFELLYTVVLSSKELRMELAVTNMGECRLATSVSDRKLGTLNISDID